MKKNVGIGLAVFLTGIIGYRVITHGEEPAIKDIDTYQEELGIPVEVQKVNRGRLTMTRDFTGTIEGAKQADAISNTTRKVVALKVSVGQSVKQGQVVAELDVDIASNMTLRYNQSLAQLEAAKKQLRRMKSLYDAGAVSEQAYDDAMLRFAIAKKNHDAATKLVQIPAPISGVVTHIYVKEGETVNTGQAVVRIARLDEIVIEISINETEISGVQKDQDAIVSVSAYPNTLFPGKIGEVSLSADDISRSFTAWVRVENKNHLLKPGMFAKVKILVAVKEDALTISKDALIENDNKTFVYVVTATQVAELREVHLGKTSRNMVEIQSGLVEHEQVVVFGHNKLRPGTKVNVTHARVVGTP